MARGMNIDLQSIQVEPVEEGDAAFHDSLTRVLERITPLAAAAPGLEGEQYMRRLAQAVNLAVDALEELTGMADPELLPRLIDRVAELTVSGDNIEIQLGVAGDLRVDKRHHLIVDDLLASLQRVPTSTRPAALRQGVNALQRLLALLLLHGWTDGMGESGEARQAARRAIVDAVQGHQYLGQTAV